MSVVPPSCRTCPDCRSPLPEGVSPLLCPVCAMEGAAPTSLMLGSYVLGAEIARGGMGVVYRATQQSLKREVAVKVLPGAVFSAPEFRQRFQREAETAARLNHPGIVAIHEVGEHQGQPFLAMELIQGRSLAERLQSGRMTSDLAAHLLRQVAEAVAHAHERGVIHRDLKPSNILLRNETEPVLTDFGLARFTQSGQALTQSAQSVGSPGYMPPERMLRGDLAPSVAEDVYGLGAVLYHCLCERPPFVADSVAAVLAAAQTEDPVPPRALNSSLPMDLETICLRCLEKQPTSRYGSAAEVAAELDRYLRGEPIHSRPVNLITRLAKRARRQPLLASLSAALVLSVMLGLVGSLWGWQKARDEAEQRRVELYSSQVSAAAAALMADHPAQARALLAQVAPAHGEEDLRGPEWHVLQHLMQPQEWFEVKAHAHILTSVAWSPDGARLLSAAHDGSLKCWRLQQRKLVLEKELIAPGTPRIHQVQWLDAETVLAAEEGAWVRCRAVESGKVLWELPGGQFSQAAGRLAISSAGSFYYQPAGQLSLWKMNQADAPQPIPIPQMPCRAVSLSPDGRWLALAKPHSGAADRERGIRLLDLSQPNTPPREIPTAGPVWSLQFAPDSKRLLATLFQGSTDILPFDVPTGAPLAPLHGHSLRPWAVVFDPQSSQMLSVSSDRSLRLWQDGREINRLTAAHENEIWCAALSPRGDLLASGDKDGVLKLFPFPLPTPRIQAMSRRPRYRYDPLIFSPNTGKLVDSPKGESVLGFSSDRRLWSLRDQSFVTRDTPAAEWRLPAPALFAAMCGGGDYAFVIQKQGIAQRVDLRDGSTQTVAMLKGLTQKDELKAASLSPSGRYLAAADWHELVLHDFQTGQTLRLSNDPHWARDIAFSPDSTLMATAGIDGHIHLRRTSDGSLLARLDGHMEEASGLAFSPDGKTLVSCELGLGLRFWRLDTLREVFALPLADMAESVAFSPDGRFLAVTLCRLGANPEDAQVMLIPCGPGGEMASEKK